MESTRPDPLNAENITISYQQRNQHAAVNQGELNGRVVTVDSRRTICSNKCLIITLVISTIVFIACLPTAIGNPYNGDVTETDKNTAGGFGIFAMIVMGGSLLKLITNCQEARRRALEQRPLLRNY